MESLINTNEDISDIALAYYDDKLEVLKEISEQGTYFSVAPFSVTYKRLYVIGDLLYNNAVKITAELPPEFANLYEVKLRFGQVYNQVGDFDSATNTVTGSYETLGFKYLNAVPLDVLVISKNMVEMSTGITFIITIGDEPSVEVFTCAGNASTVRLMQIDYNPGEGTNPIEVHMDGDYVGDIVLNTLPSALNGIISADLNASPIIFRNLDNKDHKLVIKNTNVNAFLGETNYSVVSYGYNTYMCLKRADFTYTVKCASTGLNYITFYTGGVIEAQDNYNIYVDDGLAGTLREFLEADSMWESKVINGLKVQRGLSETIFENRHTDNIYKVEFRPIDTSGPLLEVSEGDFTTENSSIFTCLAPNEPM